MVVAGFSHNSRYFASVEVRSLSLYVIRVFFVFFTSFVGSEGGGSASGSSPVVLGPASEAEPARAVRGDLRLGTLSFFLRLGDEAPVPRRFFLPPAMAVNVDGGIIDELFACSATEKIIKRWINNTWDEKGSQRAGLDVTSFW